MPNTSEPERSTPPTVRNRMALWALVLSGIAILVVAIFVIATAMPGSPQRGIREVVQVPER